MDESVTPRDDQVERWLPVEGYEGLYDVSSHGRVRSWHRGRGSGKRGGLLRPGLSTTGHWTVSLRKDGRAKTFPVHKLVTRAFIGPRPSGLMVRHGRAGKLDNRLSNLSYGTRKQNSDDTVRDGVRAWGEQIPNSILREDAVAECRRRYAAGEKTAVLAVEFGVSQPTMSNAITGKHWGHISEPPVVLSATDRQARRGSKGVEHHNAKLTPDIVRECRRRWAEGETSYALADEFGVKQPSMHKALTGGTWKHVA